jgi:hypothetical protein
MSGVDARWDEGINLSHVGGAAAKTGAGTAAGAVRVELPTDGTGKVGLNAGSAVVGKVSIDQTTPATTNAVHATNLPATVDTNSGNKSASTPRVVLATDQPNLTTPLNANVAQINGVTPLMGTGNTGTGSQRVTLATDQANLTTALNVAPQAVATGGASFTNVAAGQATTVIKASAGTLYAICFNGVAAGGNVTTVYDNASGSGTVIAIPDATGVDEPATLTFGPVGLAFTLGLTVITGTANGCNMTFVYK